MSFVPVGDIHMAVFETRVRDFESFVKATGYDAEGGMSSVMKLDGFASRNLSWRSPGFPQTPDHPVVGVCWEDADQFCAWLTKKERSEGALTAFQRYRLPTDREWSEAVGIAHEEGATPEERSARLRVFPWGGAMPPPEDVGNYAGEESRPVRRLAGAFCTVIAMPFRERRRWMPCQPIPPVCTVWVAMSGSGVWTVTINPPTGECCAVGLGQRLVRMKCSRLIDVVMIRCSVWMTQDFVL